MPSIDPSRPIAVHFGAGNIGRGFIGPLLSKTHHVIFVDVQKDIIDALNTEDEYDIHVLGSSSAKSNAGGEENIEHVSDVEALQTNSEETIDAIGQADIVTTSVGPNVLPKLAGPIAKGLRERGRRNDKSVVNVIACENLIGATSKLKQAVVEAVKDLGEGSEDSKTMEYIERCVGFANCTVDRIVPPFESESKLDVAVEEFYEWIVDRKALKEPYPKVDGATYVDQLDAFVERKLYTLNTAHATLAYLGFLKGFKTIDQSLKDDRIRKTVNGVLKETGAALMKKHSDTFEPSKHEEYVQKVLKRFENPKLNDEVTRIGRSPLRKLAKDDRLVGPVNMARGYGLGRDNLLMVIAAAMHFDVEEDEESVKMRKIIREKGIEDAVTEFTGIEKGGEDFEAILKHYQEVSGIFSSTE